MSQLNQNRQASQVELSGRKLLFAPPIGLLILKGKDIIDFFHRMSTNDTTGIQEGEGITTILTNDKGRVVDVVDLYRQGEWTYLIHSSGTEEEIKELIDKYVIMEDVQITETVYEYCYLTLDDGGNNITKQIEQEGEITYLTSPRISPNGKIILSKENIENDLVDKYQPIEFQEFNTIRLELGIPLYPYDFNKNVNPLEANLNEYISWTKGCYVGQEVIARLDTYKKIKQFLKGIVFESIFCTEDVEYLSSPQNSKKIEIFDDSDQVIGELTSFGYSNKLRNFMGFGRIQRGKENAGSKIKIRPTKYNYIGKIVDLPIIKQ